MFAYCVSPVKPETVRKAYTCILSRVNKIQNMRSNLHFRQTFQKKGCFLCLHKCFKCYSQLNIPVFLSLCDCEEVSELRSIIVVNKVRNIQQLQCSLLKLNVLKVSRPRSMEYTSICVLCRWQHQVPVYINCDDNQFDLV